MQGNGTTGKYKSDRGQQTNRQTKTKHNRNRFNYNISKYIPHKDTAKFVGIIINLFSEKYSGPGPVMEKHTHDIFMAQFDSQNKKIMEEFFSDSDRTALFQPRKIVDNPSNLYPGCTISWYQTIRLIVKEILLKRH